MKKIECVTVKNLILFTKYGKMKRSPEFEVDAIVDQLASNKPQMAIRGRRPACAQMGHCYHFIERRNHSRFTVWWYKGYI